MIQNLAILVACIFLIPSTSRAQIASTCKTKEGDVYFERWKFGANPECDNGIKAPEGWELAYLTKDSVVYINYDSLVNEGSSVKFWAEFMFAQPFMFDGNKPSDNSRNLYRFDCKKRQQTLLQASFRKKERVIGEIINGNLMEEIEPGTISDALFKQVCRDAQSSTKEAPADKHTGNQFKLPFGLRFMISKSQALEQMKTLEQFQIKPEEADSIVYSMPNPDDNTKGGFFLDFRNNKLVKIESIKTGMTEQRQNSYISEVVSEITTSLSNTLESASKIENNQLYKFVTPDLVVILSGHKGTKRNNDYSVHLAFYEKVFFTSEPIAKLPFSSKLSAGDTMSAADR